jgi:phage-related holin
VGVRKDIFSYFANHFEDVGGKRPHLYGMEFSILSFTENSIISRPFTEEENKDLIFLADGNNSPGLDGFNFAFFKSFWGVIRVEVKVMFDEFHANKKLPKYLLSYFVALISKVLSPQVLNEFSPISLLGSLYKLLAKVLTVWLAEVMDTLLSQQNKKSIGFYQPNEYCKSTYQVFEKC